MSELWLNGEYERQIAMPDALYKVMKLVGERGG